MFHRYAFTRHRTALSTFEAELPEFFQQCEPLVRPLLEFLENGFDLKIGPGDLELPPDTFEKSPAQRHIQEAIIPLLMRDFEKERCDFDQVKDHDIFAVVFHWFVNYHRSTSTHESDLKRTRLARDIAAGHSHFGLEVLAQSHHIARIFAYDPTGCQPKCPPLGSRFKAGSFYGERSSNEQIDSEEASESEDEDSSSGVGEDEMAETSTHQVEHNMKVNLPTEYLNLALREIKNTQLGRVASLKLDDSLLPESLRQPLQNSSLGPLPLEDIAKNLLLVTKDRLATRYGDLIDASKDLREGLLRSLTPAANAVLNMNSITVDDLAGIGGSPEDDEGPGVYLHILKARQESTQPFYLYVGQASSLCLRIKDHNDRSYRKRHPCLHYRVWDLLQSACLLYESIFVKLVDLGSVLSYGVAEQRHLIINLSEMFMACALQTLRKRDLHIYLPETLRKPWADRHLNLALPLWQGLSEDPKDMRMSKASFEEALHSLDPVIRDWAVGVRNAYQSLRDHPDPRVREYWMSNFRSIQEFDGVDKAYMTAQKAAHEAALQFLTNGADCRIYQVGHGYYMAQYSIYQFSLGSMFDRWSLKDKVAGKHGLVRGKTVFVKPFLLNEPNPLRYAQHALPIDPSGRLVVAASENGGMNGKLVFLFGSQEKQAMRLNRLVDTMEGLSFHESECLARRGIRKKRKWIYTTETLPDVSCP